MKDTGLKTPWGGNVFFTPQTTSTMDEAQIMENSGYPEGSLIWAEEQTQGRGRFPERQWLGNKGQALLFTFYLSVKTISSLPFPPSLTCGLGIIRWLNSFDHRGFFSIKWPNDIYWQEKKTSQPHKICGILVLSKLNKKSFHFGIGINLNPISSGENFKKMAGDLTAAGIYMGAEQALMTVLPKLAEAFNELKPVDLITPYLYSPSEGISLEIPSPTGSKVIQGQVMGLSIHGELQLKTPLGIQNFSTGE